MSEQPMPMVQRDYRRRASIHRASSPTFSELGVAGLRQYGGFVVEEWLRTLSGRRAVWVWREMADNDATIGAILFAIEMLARGVPWEVEEGSESGAAEFVEECRQDMSSTWNDIVSEILTMLPFGWAWCEEVFKRREGPQPDRINTSGDPGGQMSKPSSRFNDGKVGWRKLPLRAQETLWRWQFDESGGIQAMEQIGWDGVKHFIPIQKSLLFRTRTTKGNPEGRSLMRNAYVAWFRKKNIEEIEAIGVERDLAGIPVAKPPTEFDLYADANKPVREAAEEMVSTIRRDEDEGIVLPGGWELELLSSGGSRQLDTNEIIRRYQQAIATSVLADMLLIGQDKVGSYAMVDAKADIFGAFVDTAMEGIAEVFNRYAIPRLLALNGMSLDDPPKLQPGTVRRIDLDALAQLLERLSAAGAVVFPDNDVLASIYQRAGLPEPASISTEKAEGAPDLPPLARSYKTAASQHELELSRDMSVALKEFAEEAASAYERMANKAEGPSEVAKRILAKVGVSQFARKLGRAWFNHYGKVADGVVKSFSHQLLDEGREPEVDVGTGALTKLKRDGALRVAKLSIEGQLRDSLERALKEAEEQAPGDWREAADRIRRDIPAGRFVKAGSAYRSRLIARTETANAQRLASLASYEAHPDVTAVKLLDGLMADSDADCKARSGKVIDFKEAAEAIASPTTHPNCTLTLLPVFGPASSN